MTRKVKEKLPSRAGTEWYFRVGRGEFVMPFPQELVFLAISKVFLLSTLTFDPSALSGCVRLFVGTWVFTHVMEMSTSTILHVTFQRVQTT